MSLVLPRRSQVVTLAAAAIALLSRWMVPSSSDPSSSTNGSHAEPTTFAAPAPELPSHSPSPASDQGLATALDLARREIMPLTQEEAALPLNQGVSHFAWHPGQDLTARFLPGAVHFAPGGDPVWELGFIYSGAGPASSLRVEGTRAEYLHPDGVREWFDNIPAGIEHGFTLDRRPAAGPNLQVSLAGLNAIADGPDLLLCDASGQPHLRYSGLKAWDADGKDLTASMAPVPGGLRFTVDDSRARYPLTIDPILTTFVQELGPTITGTGSSNENFGSSVALEGNTAIIGSSLDNTAAGYQSGSAFVFTRVDGTWQLLTRLVPTGLAAGDYLGSCVALAGNYAIIGAPFDDIDNAPDAGSYCVFHHSQGAWKYDRRITRQLQDGAGARFGWFADLSGETLAIGAPVAGGGGVVCVYRLSDGVWLLQQRIQAPAGALGFCRVALDEDNLVIGAPESEDLRGRAYYYKRSGTSWTGSLITRPFVTADAAFGDAVAVSGNTVMVSASGALDYRGTTCVYVFPIPEGTTWVASSQLQADLPRISHFGRVLAMDGDRAVIGAPYETVADNDEAGRVFFAEPNAEGVWELLHAATDSQVVRQARFGSALAIDGDTALIGAPHDVTAAGKDAGSATFFNFAAGAWGIGQEIDVGDDAGSTGYGSAVAIDGDHLALSSPLESNAAGARMETVRIFARIGGIWTSQARFTDPLGRHGTGFGEALAISGDHLIVGIPNVESVDAEPLSYGAVALYRHQDGQWSFLQEFSGAGYLGRSVAIDGDTAVAGAPLDDGAGSVSIFTRSGGEWSMEVTKLPAPEIGSSSHFGHAVAIEGNRVLVGAPYGSSPGGNSQGHVYSYLRTGLTWAAGPLIAQDAAPVKVTGFGLFLDLSRDSAVVGAQSNDSVSIHFFALRNGAWVRNGFRKYSARFTGSGARVALHRGLALVALGNGSTSHLLEFRNEGWADRDHLPFGTASVAVSDEHFVAGSPTESRLNPLDDSFPPYQGNVWIFDILRREGYLVRTFDLGGDGFLDLSEWGAIFEANTPNGALFPFIDADTSGTISPAELAAAASITPTRTNKKSIAAVTTILDRTGVFIDLDNNAWYSDANQLVTVREVAQMWKPGTPAIVINTFWKRAKVGSDFNLGTWLRAKTLPSIPAYHFGQEIRARRFEIGRRYDFDFDGNITKAEFEAMLLAEGGTSGVNAAWKALTGEKMGEPVPSIWIEFFVEAPGFPKLRTN